MKTNGKRMNRLSHMMLKFLVKEIIRGLNQKDIKEDITATIELVTKVMAKAELKEDFKFSTKDYKDATVEKICKYLEVDSSKYLEIVDKRKGCEQDEDEISKMISEILDMIKEFEPTKDDKKGDDK